MNIINENIDGGKAFDWGKTSADYARFRDIYPEEFYRKLKDRGLCVKGQRILDMGTGTGVLPRNMHRFGGKWTGIDISPEQINEARRLSRGMDIDYYPMSAEDIAFEDNSFDVITACQCFWYFDHEKIMPRLHAMLKSGGRLLVLYMAWLPFEDKIAGESERIVLKYNPGWSGAGETLHPIFIPDCYSEKFELYFHEEYYLDVPFTRENWHGRMRACRGVGASLSPEEIALWEREHMKMLNENAPCEFTVRHYGAMAELVAK